MLTARSATALDGISAEHHFLTKRHRHYWARALSLSVQTSVPDSQFPQPFPQNLFTWLSTGREGFLTQRSMGQPGEQLTVRDRASVAGAFWLPTTPQAAFVGDTSPAARLGKSAEFRQKINQHRGI